jgi:hypothetical protein
MHQNGKSKTDGFQFLMLLFLCDGNHFFIAATVGELPVLRATSADGVNFIPYINLLGVE